MATTNQSVQGSERKKWMRQQLEAHRFTVRHPAHVRRCVVADQVHTLRQLPYSLSSMFIEWTHIINCVPLFWKVDERRGVASTPPPARPCYEKCPGRGLTLGAFSALTTMKRITALFWASPILSEMANYATNRSPNQSQKRLN